VRYILEKLFNSLWYDKKYSWFGVLLMPLSVFYQYFSQRLWRKKSVEHTQALPVPVVVVGNLVVGGSGKTPVTQALALALQARGIQVGIVSRGYGGTVTQATLVDANYPKQFGDEPCLLAKTTQVPVAVARHRRDAVLLLCRAGVTKYPLDIILSDDGMQHVSLYRDFELCVIGRRGLGNQRCLPSGPLRESVKRLNTVNAIVSWQEQLPHLVMPHLAVPHSSNTVPCWLISGKHALLQLLNGDIAPEKTLHGLADIQAQQKFPVEVAAGLAQPDSFYTSLSVAGVQFKIVFVADHAGLSATQLMNISPKALLIVTEKDAIKLRVNVHLTDNLAARIRVVPWRVQLPTELVDSIANLVLKKR
jgi:tetraacyldisaccharide 4'-kinase